MGISRKLMGFRWHPRSFLVTAFAALVVLCWFDAQAGGSGDPSKGPRIKVADEVFDFGYVPQKSLVSHIFWLQNSGGQTLEIKKLTPNCGCTEAPLEKHQAEPGDSIRVEIAFGTSSIHGSVRKFIQVESNAAGRVPALTFTANVVSDSEDMGPLALKPSAVRLDDQRPDSTTSGWTTEVSLRNTSRSALEIRVISLPDRNVTVGDFPGWLGAGEERKIALRFGPGLPAEVFSKSITFEAVGSDTVRSTLPIFKKKPWATDPGSGNVRRP